MDELLVRDGAQWLLFVNENRAPSRLRFSIFHGIGHFCLPGHRELNYLSRGCLVRPWTTRSYERQAHAFAAVMNMPRRRFRGDMADLPLALSSVESLAGRYLASVEEFLTEGEAAGPLLGLRREAKLWVERLPQGHVGAVLALVRPTPMPPGSPVYRDWDWEQIE